LEWDAAVPDGVGYARCLSMVIIWQLHRKTSGLKNGDHAADVV
jgi:hypothetical protein